MERLQITNKVYIISTIFYWEIQICIRRSEHNIERINFTNKVYIPVKYSFSTHILLTEIQIFYSQNCEFLKNIILSDHFVLLRM